MTSTHGTAHDMLSDTQMGANAQVNGPMEYRDGPADAPCSSRTTTTPNPTASEAAVSLSPASRRGLRVQRIAFGTIGTVAGLWFLYIAIGAGLGISDRLPFAISFGRHVPAAVALFVALGLLALVPGVAGLVTGIHMRDAGQLVDVRTSPRRSVQESFQSQRGAGWACLALAGILAMLAVLGGLNVGGFAEVFVRPDLVGFGFGFTAGLVGIVGLILVTYLPSKPELTAALDERECAVQGAASACAYLFLFCAIGLGTICLALLGYLTLAAVIVLIGLTLASGVVFLLAKRAVERRM